ncbi:uncharacterized protein LOC134301411 [Trichomycterus rosablanca]|uniref:uncharacterized protein LOC134301411 n=1 Tax=Trichomycterus rosablanca TaxID=2290929 RepID=UPI002F360B01
MGHDIRVHCDFYRQTDKTLQLSRISKLLFAMEKGTETIKGQNLNTLNFSLPGSSKAQDPQKQRSAKQPSQNKPDNVAITETEDNGDRDDDDGPCTRVKRKLIKDPGFDLPKTNRLQRSRKKDDNESTEMDEDNDGDYGSVTTSKQRKRKLMEQPKTSETKRRAWSEEEQAAVFKHLAVFLERFQVPGKADCLKCTQNESALKYRTWRDVKYFIHNKIVSRAKKNH